jgi:hypothetical protein
MTSASEQQLLQSLSGVSKDDLDRMIRVLRDMKSGLRRPARSPKRQCPDPLLALETSTMETGNANLAEQHGASLHGNKPGSATPRPQIPSWGSRQPA